MAKQIALTDAKLKHLKPKDQPYEVRDAAAPGLRVRVYPSGTKVFRWMAKNTAGKNIVTTLGKYPQLSLAKARKQLEDEKLKHEVRRMGEGIDGEDDVKTVEQLAEAYYKHRILPYRKRPENVRSILDKWILPTYGKRKLNQVTTGSCRQMVLAVVKAGYAPRAAKVLAVVKQMFRFAVGNGHMDIDPAASLEGDNLGVVKNVRNRALSADEIQAFMLALDQHTRLSVQTRIALKILLLTAVRTGELLKAKWKNVDLEAKTWTIPVSDQKLTKKAEQKARPFVVPLSDQAVTLFEEARRAAGRSPYVMASHSKTGRIDDKALGHVMRAMFRQGRLEMDTFTPHDLRRTCRTHLSKLRVPPHVAERCLNHSLGAIQDVYDTHDYLDERREAMQRWADQVDVYLGAVENVRELRYG